MWIIYNVWFYYKDTWIISQPSALINCVEIAIKLNKVWNGRLEVQNNLTAIKDQTEIRSHIHLGFFFKTFK